MSLTADRNTPFKAAMAIPVPVAAGAVIHAGALVAANATGYAVPGSTATTLTYIGRAESAIDNAAGADGAKTLVVGRNTAFKWKNSAGDPVTQAELCKTVYIVDDETVAKTNGAGTRSAAGKVVQLEADGVWVE